MKGDRDCNYAIPSGSSGFCECESGRKAGLVRCGHKKFTCNDVCISGKIVGISRDTTRATGFATAATVRMNGTGRRRGERNARTLAKLYSFSQRVSRMRFVNLNKINCVVLVKNLI